MGGWAGGLSEGEDTLEGRGPSVKPSIRCLSLEDEDPGRGGPFTATEGLCGLAVGNRMLLEDAMSPEADNCNKDIAACVCEEACGVPALSSLGLRGG